MGPRLKATGCGLSVPRILAIQAAPQHLQPAAGPLPAFEAGLTLAAQPLLVAARPLLRPPLPPASVLRI